MSFLRVWMALWGLGMAGLLSAQAVPASLRWKSSPTLLFPVTVRQAEPNTPVVADYPVVVADLDVFQAWLQTSQLPVRVVGRYRPANILVLETSREIFLDKILPHPGLRYADQLRAVPEEEMPVPGHNLFVNQINGLHARYPALDGSGRTVSVKENRPDTLDVDLRGRLYPFTEASPLLTQHASAMATLIAGAGTSELSARGVARGARVVSADFAGLLPDEASTYALLDVSVQNHSYGAGGGNYYSPSALAYDQSVVQRPALLHVFSAGNSGHKAADLGSYTGLPGFANLTGPFKMAKNVLTVGAVDSFSQVVAYSSRGPAYDGRIKPDLVAFGQDGSSGAAALVSGVALALQQAYAQTHDDSLPAAALLRAILINSADDLGTPGPDYRSGYGQLNAWQAVQTLVDQRFITQNIAAGETRAFLLDVPAGIRQLRATLSWDDVPAWPGASKALVNDLDLVVRSPSGEEALPWTLNAFPQADSLALPAVAGRDTLNNTEQVTIDFPEPGQYLLRVSGTAVPGGFQAFALAYVWDTLDAGRWTYPASARDALPAGREVVLRWDSDELALAQPMRLEYRLATSASWQLADATVDFAAGYRRWTPPDTFAEVQLRLVGNNLVIVSDTLLVAPDLHLKVGFTCPDSALLFWNSAGPGAAYQLYGLGSFYLEPLLVLTDTLVVLAKSVYNQPRFAVAPLGPSGRVGERSAAPDIGEQGVGCYFQTFFAQLNDDRRVNLSLRLGSTYGLQAARLEKWTDGQFLPLQSWQPVPSTILDGQDSLPQTGVNRYRARLDLPNGAVLFSDTLTVYVLPEREIVLIWPNPVEVSGQLSILSNTAEDAVWELFDALGRRVLERALDDSRVEVQLPELPRGVYFWRIKNPGAKRPAGRLLVGF